MTNELKKPTQKLSPSKVFPQIAKDIERMGETEAKRFYGNISIEIVTKAIERVNKFAIKRNRTSNIQILANLEDLETLKIMLENPDGAVYVTTNSILAIKSSVFYLTNHTSDSLREFKGFKVVKSNRSGGDAWNLLTTFDYWKNVRPIKR
jgi:hypothetical protein